MSDIPIPELNLVLHQPRIEEISMIGQQDYFAAIQYLCLNKESLIEDEEISSQVSNFQVLMEVIHQSDDKRKKTVLINTLSLYFPNYSVGITPKTIFFLDRETRETVSTIDENNFEILQKVIRDVSCIHNLLNKDEVVYNPQGEAAKKIAEKIYKARQKKAALKQKKEQQDNIFNRYISILAIGIHLFDAEKLTVYRLFDYVERYQLYLSWDIDIRSRLAGAQPKNEAENWMKNLYE